MRAALRTVSEILVEHAARYPRWEAADVYKLLFQAAMGSEHAVPDEASARAWLARESEEMGSGPDEPLVDPISPDGDIVRVHLRPYVRLGLDWEILLRAFVGTATEFRGRLGALDQSLEIAERVAAGRALGPRQGDLRELHQRARRAGFPSMHHSEPFRTLHRPAYRVIARAFLPPGVRRAGMAAEGVEP